MPSDDEDAEAPPPPPPKVFISRVDTYFGRILAQHLGGCVPNETGAEDGGNEKEENVLDSSIFNQPSKEGSYSLSGSWNVSLKTETAVVKLTGNIPVSAPVVPALQNLIVSDDEKALKSTIQDADICVLSLMDEDGKNCVFEDVRKAVEIARKSVLDSKKAKTVILISSVLTWAKTRRPGQEDGVEEPDPAEALPEDEEEEAEGFHEEDYKKRLPHPSYRKYLELEKDLLKYGRDSKGLLTTTVVAAGLIYGYGESALHWMFKDAWQGTGEKKPVVVPGDGKNHVPMIHARDLCQVIQQVSELKPKIKYIFAVDDGKVSLSKVCQSISKILTIGETVSQPADDLLTAGKINQCQLDILTCDIRLTPATIKDAMKIQWVAEKGLFDSANMVVQEFRVVRNLTPVKLAVLGPPFSGKTPMAKKLAEFYEIFYLDVVDVVREAMDALHTVIEEAKAEAIKKAALSEEEEVEENEEEGPTKAELAQELVNKIEEGRLNNSGNIEDMYILQFVRERLLHPTCQNQGYVLDNFPDSHAKAVELFKRTDADGEALPPVEDDEESQVVVFDPKIIPDFVVFLDSSEDFLRKRMMLQPDPGTVTTTATISVEQNFKQRMKEWKISQENNEATAIAYFDETETPTITLPSSDDPAENSIDINLKTVVTRIGPPHNYGLTVQQREDITQREETAKEVEADEKLQTSAAKSAEEYAARRRHCSEWSAQMDDIYRRNHQEILNGTPPIREYLEKNVLPSVHRGLLEMIKCKPQDPIDFLGGFLIQLTNPLQHGPVLPVDEQLLKVAKI